MNIEVNCEQIDFIIEMFNLNTFFGTHKLIQLISGNYNNELIKNMKT